jgi:hypothetical protein
MKKVAVLLCFTAIMAAFSTRSHAQFYFLNNDYYDTEVLFEVGVSGGAMNCLTDIGGTKGIGKKFTKDLNLGNTRFNGSFYIGALYRYAIGLRLEGTYGKVSAYDSILSDVPKTDIARARYNRNLSFRSVITEVNLVAEFHPIFIFGNHEARDEIPPLYSPYLMIGVGYFSFNPQAKLGNRWVDLQPLSTEGQGFPQYPDRKPYKLSGITMPIGIGMKYELTSFLNVRGEFLYRFTNTDYLDDVSTTYIDPKDFANNLSATRFVNAFLLYDRNRKEYLPQTLPGKKRGDTSQNDGYFTFNLKFGLNIGRQRIK